MKRLVLAVVAFVVVGCASAQSQYNTVVQEGTVESSMPAYGQPQQLYTTQCGVAGYQTQQSVQSSGPTGMQIAGQVLGTLGGAVIGNQFGGGNGRTIATVIGGVAGNEISRPHPQQQVVTQQVPVQQCVQVPAGFSPPPLIGYTIRYNWNGMLYQGFTSRSYNPGEKVRLEVGVRMLP